MFNNNFKLCSKKNIKERRNESRRKPKKLKFADLLERLFPGESYYNSKNHMSRPDATTKFKK